MLKHRLVCGEKIKTCYFSSSSSLSFSSAQWFSWSFWHQNGEGNEVGFETVSTSQTQSCLCEVCCLISLIGSRFSLFLLWFNQNFFSGRDNPSCRAKDRVPCGFSSYSGACVFHCSWKWDPYIWEWWEHFLSFYCSFIWSYGKMQFYFGKLVFFNLLSFLPLKKNGFLLFRNAWIWKFTTHRGRFQIKRSLEKRKKKNIYFLWCFLLAVIYTVFAFYIK